MLLLENKIKSEYDKHSVNFFCFWDPLRPMVHVVASVFQIMEQNASNCVFYITLGDNKLGLLMLLGTS